MELQFPSSLSFLSTTVLCRPDNQSLTENDKEVSNTLAEVYGRFVLSKQVDHPNLCKYIEIEKLEKNLISVISESHSLNIEKLFLSRAGKKQHFSEEEVAEIMINVLKGLNKIASFQVPYLSLRPENIQVTDDGLIKLLHPFDYFLYLDYNRYSEYQAPEVQSNQVFVFKTDTWSLGIIIVELLRLSKAPKFSENSFKSFCDLHPLNISSDLKSLLTNLIQVNPNDRLDIIDALHHPYFTPKPIQKASLILSPIYHLFKKYKNLDNAEKLKIFLINNGTILSTLQQNLNQNPNLSFVLKRSTMSLEGFAESLKKEIDSESYTNETKIFSENASVKPGSFIGKIGGFFKSKSVKSSDSGSSSQIKSIEGLPEVINKYKFFYKNLKDGEIAYTDVPKDGFPPYIRQEIWKKILNLPQGYTYLYQFMRDTRKFELNKQVSLDIPRCHKQNLLLTSSLGRYRLETILKLWLSKNNGIKYSQGLDSIAAVCISLYEDDESAAYFSFCQIISKYLLQVLKNEDLIGNFLLVLRNLISFLDPVLANHLNQNNINPEMYATSWLLTLYSHNFPLSSVYVLWDLLLQKQPEFIFVVAYSILQQFRDKLMENTQNDIIGFLSGLNCKIDLERCIQDSLEYFEQFPSGICKIAYPHSGQSEWEKELPFEVAQATRVPLISMQDCEKIIEDYIIVDTRSLEDYNKLRINGSISLPVKLGNVQDILPSIKLTQAQLQAMKEHGKNKTIILLGDKSLSAHSLANILVKQGVPRVCILRGGIEVIKAANT